MVKPDRIKTDFLKKKPNQTDLSMSGKGNLGQFQHTQTKSESLSMAYYEQLMRHDWHVRVHHRVKQRGWGW